MTGEVTGVDNAPFYGSGSVAAVFHDGSALVVGGLVETDATNQLAVTNFAVLRAGTGLADCVPIVEGELDAGQDVGEVGLDVRGDAADAAPDTLGDGGAQDLGDSGPEDVPDAPGDADGDSTSDAGG
jgi:hypothetical protein